MSLTPQEWCKKHLQPGRKLKIYFDPGNLNNCTVHIRAVVDGGQVVTARWIQHRQAWWYKVENRYFFELLREKKQLSTAGKSDESSFTV